MFLEQTERSVSELSNCILMISFAHDTMCLVPLCCNESQVMLHSKRLQTVGMVNFNSRSRLGSGRTRETVHEISVKVMAVVAQVNTESAFLGAVKFAKVIRILSAMSAPLLISPPY